MKKCKNKKCGTLWLDPTPKKESLSDLYSNYSTHKKLAYTPPLNTATRKILEYIRSSYLYIEFGYPTNTPHWLIRPLSCIAYLYPSWRDTQAANIFYIPFVKKGKLLDFGCGSGGAMQTMKQKGWGVTGIDFDEDAIAIAEQKGLDVYVGDLSSHQFSEEEFDIIMMNHVIEHVPDPTELLRECKRILKCGGLIVALTPNADSRGHSYYKNNWRGLETPHHLQVFTVKSLALMAQDIGFSEIRCFSSIQGGPYILRASANIKKGKPSDTQEVDTLFIRIKKQILLLVLGWLHLLNKNHDEVAVLVCKK